MQALAERENTESQRTLRLDQKLPVSRNFEEKNMFEHKSLDGEKYRLLPASEGFVADQILEHRDPQKGQGITSASRYQHGVANALLVERYLPPETVGDAWPHDASATPWWTVVDNPPHAGIVAEYNEAFGGTYRRKLVPEKNVVAFAEKGEEVVLSKGTYTVIRSSDSQELTATSLLALRAAYYA